LAVKKGEAAFLELHRESREIIKMPKFKDFLFGNSDLMLPLRNVKCWRNIESEIAEVRGEAENFASRP